MSHKKVTLHSDGTPKGTVLLDEDGNSISDILEVDLHIDAHSVMEVRATLRMTPVIVEGHMTGASTMCPGCETYFTHECSETIGGAPGGFTAGQVQTMLPNIVLPAQGQSVTYPSTFPPCSSSNGSNYCKIKSKVNHTVHVDTDTGFAWSYASVTIRLAFGNAVVPIKL